jgi:hypothetical protein
MMSAVSLGKGRGIWNRPTESGSRWQGGGNFAVDGEGIVVWGKIAERADEVVDFEDVTEIVNGQGNSGGSKL